jgi:hypothetical protein
MFNIEAPSCNHCCRRKAKLLRILTVFVALVIHHAKRVRRIVSYVACVAVPYLFILSHKLHDFRKDVFGSKIRIFGIISFTNSSLKLDI